VDWVAILADPVTVSAVAGCLALILFAAAWHKFSEPDIFAGALDAYGLLPGAGVMIVARLLPWLELLIGVLLLLPALRRVGLVAFAVLILLYGGAIAINLLRGKQQIDCGCGGDVHLLSWGLIVRNGLLVCLALAVSGTNVDRPYMWLDAITLLAGVLALYATYLTYDELLRQFGRIAHLSRTHSGYPA
jgi:uncharacterized membrane protein YphA (DoxX/SURF4 family)